MAVPLTAPSPDKPLVPANHGIHNAGQQKNALERAQIFLSAIRSMSLADLASPEGKGGDHTQMKAILKMAQNLQEAFGAPDIHKYVPLVGKSVLFENVPFNVKSIPLPFKLPEGVLDASVIIAEKDNPDAIVCTLPIDSTAWNGCDTQGNPVSCGMYRYYIKANENLSPQVQEQVAAQQGILEVPSLPTITLAYQAKVKGPAVLHIYNERGSLVESVSMEAHQGSNLMNLAGSGAKDTENTRRFGAGRYTFSVELQDGERVHPFLSVPVEGITTRENKVFAVGALGEYDLEKMEGLTASAPVA